MRRSTPIYGQGVILHLPATGRCLLAQEVEAVSALACVLREESWAFGFGIRSSCEPPCPEARLYQGVPGCPNNFLTVFEPQNVRGHTFKKACSALSPKHPNPYTQGPNSPNSQPQTPRPETSKTSVSLTVYLSHGNFYKMVMPTTSNIGCGDHDIFDGDVRCIPHQNTRILTGDPDQGRHISDTPC